MSTIRKRNGKWQALVRRNGSRQISRTFHDRKSAEKWARALETRLDAGFMEIPAEPQFSTFGEVIARYEREYSCRKRGYWVEKYRIRILQRCTLSALTPLNVTGPKVAAFRDARLKETSPATTRRELGLLRHILEIARKEWGVAYRGNPVDEVQKPQPPKGRSRRLASEEERKLFTALDRCLNPQIPLIARLAIETGMQRGEILKLQWIDINLEKRTALLRETKNGEDRNTPLSPAAITILLTAANLNGTGGLVFRICAGALHQTWTRIVRKVGITDLRFHDLRHEAISRFFERGLSVPEVALISGHKTPSMLFRYTHLKPEAVAQKMSEQAQ